MKLFKVRLPSPDEHTIFSPEAAERLVGQKINFAGFPAVVKEAKLNEDPHYVDVTIELED